MDNKEFLSIAEVSKAAGISSRTLRHYDDIELLTPASVGDNGYRFYGPSELLRLQRILVMRELEMNLSEIKSVLDNKVSEIDALRRHRVEVAQRQERLADVLATVDRTINELAAGGGMNPAELFEGFDPVKQAAYEQELVDTYGQSAQVHIDESKRRMATWTPEQAREIARGFGDAERALAEMIDDGATPEEQRVQSVIADHYQVVCQFWTPDAEQYAGLGQMYCDHAEFRARKDALHPQLAEFEREAMAIYAECVL